MVYLRAMGTYWGMVHVLFSFGCSCFFSFYNFAFGVEKGECKYVAVTLYGVFDRVRSVDKTRAPPISHRWGSFFDLFQQQEV